jgi:hypothetical protein
MVIMDDETDHLLDTFLDVASGERTAKTRDRYQRTLAHLRTPVEGETGCGPGVRLLLRVAHQLQRPAGGVPGDQYDTMPSLFERLVTWLRRHSDAGQGDASCVLYETLAVLRDTREERYRQRYRQRFGDPSDAARGSLAAPPGRGDEWPVNDAWWEEAGYPSNLYAFPGRE